MGDGLGVEILCECCSDEPLAECNCADPTQRGKGRASRFQKQVLGEKGIYQFSQSQGASSLIPGTGIHQLADGNEAGAQNLDCMEENCIRRRGTESEPA